MAKLEKTTYQQMQQYCEGATQTALYKGNEKYQRALQSLFERFAEEVYEVKGTAKNGLKCLDLEIGGVMYTFSYNDSYFKSWSICEKNLVPMSAEKASEQRARLNRMFGK